MIGAAPRVRVLSMWREVMGNWSWVGWIGVSAVVLACSGSNDGGQNENSGERVVCPQCQRASGGETSDFGDGSEYLFMGDAVYPEPTPCELSTQAIAIDEAAARTEGFGRSLDQLTRSFTLPFQWSPHEVSWGGPAAGYTPSTQISGVTEVARIEHLVPSLEGCEDSLRLQVAMALQTEDGALSIAGELQTTVGRSIELAAVYGLLDLSEARGTLEISLPSDADSLVGFVQVAMYLWPEEVRMDVGVVALEPRWIGSDTPGAIYDPLGGRGPIDACETYARPLALDEPVASAGGASVSELYEEMLALVAVDQPKRARWSSGGDTTVRFSPGEPFDACDQQNGIGFKTPYRVTSADERVDIASDANGYMRSVDGALESGWFEIYPRDQVEIRDTFASNTGISGVDFSELGGARWHTELYVEPNLDPSMYGEVTVEGVDIDGHVTGIPFAVTGVLDSLTW